MIVASILGRHTVLRLSWDREDLDHRMVYLTDNDQKNGKHESTPINDKALEASQRRKEFRDSFHRHAPWVIANRKGKRIADVTKGC